MDEQELVVPFISQNDANAYIEMLQYAAHNRASNINMVIYIEGIQAGKFVFKPTKH